MPDMNLGVYALEIGGLPLLCAGEERELGKRARDGDETALEALVEGNMRLVVYLAKKYVGRGLDFADLVQEGNEGLVIAAGRFNPDRGVRFSTYACWWIRHKIGRAIENTSRMVRLPTHLNTTFRKMARAADNGWKAACESGGVDTAKGAAIAGAGLRAFSLDDKYDEDRTWGDRLADERPSPLAVCEERRMLGWLRGCLAGLPDKERDALMRWAGMTPGDRPNCRLRRLGLRRLRRMAGE